ncbi:unnamed protein product [Aphanomyces euteiches]|uniref:Uncharacterized protein n=1 Tax=Aphanomyces euteiches TaxID=100861 RepID=A0A6G0X1X9_9STRA|nr:hypothetical protein Ae201684_009363 [Aphanomyces euteiches]KAH9070599.1 hypothetical protein Ae201684P_002956 [Aphanomyces euteiches]KAH9156512.1 hypothetical protein AeRB84_001587 [Aphanomyces euteiches]
MRPPKTARRESSRRLSPRIVESIAGFIPTAKFFFDFLIALEPLSLLGDLQHFLDLARLDRQADSAKVRRHDLWPELHVRWLDTSVVEHIEHVAKYFKTVHFHLVFDLDLIDKCIPRHISLALYGWPTAEEISTPMTEWCARLASMNVSHVAFADVDTAGVDEGGQALVTLLPQFSSLESLNLEEVHAEYMSDAMGFLCSSQLRRLALGSYEHPVVLTAEFAWGLSVWLKREPVISVSLAYCTVADDHDATMHSFYKALFTSGVESIHLNNCKLTHLETCSFAKPLDVTQLTLESTQLTDKECRVLFDGLKDATTKELVLDDMIFSQQTAGSLAKGLRKSKLATLAITNSRLDDEGCALLAEALPHSSLVKLKLTKNRLMDSSVVHIANAIVDARHLRRLNLSRNMIQFAGAVALVQSAGRRIEPLDVLNLTGIVVNKDTTDFLKAMAADLPMLKRYYIRANGSMYGAMQEMKHQLEAQMDVRVA